MGKWIQFVIARRLWVVILTTIVTLLLMSRLGGLSVIIDPDDSLPQTHPYIVVNNIIEKTFGNKFTVVIGITAKEGTIYQASVLEKVKRITERVTQLEGVVMSNVNSLAARKAKNISGNAEGMTVSPLMEKVPSTPEEMANL